MAVAANRGTGGSVLDAQYGSSSTSNTNEPLLLTHTGTNYLYTSGVTGNFASAPDAAALDITGDIDIRVRVALDDWTPAAESALIGKFKAATNERSYALNIAATGVVVVRYSTTGTDSLIMTSSASAAFTDSTAYWVRVTLDVDNGAAGHTATFYFAADSTSEPSSWTLIGTPQTTAGAISLASKDSVLGVGAVNDGSGFPATGKFYRAIVRNGIDGTVVFDANFATGITSGGQTTFTESSSNAATVTINRSTSGRKSVAVVRPVWLLGTDDYFICANDPLFDMGANQDLTMLIVGRVWGTLGFQSFAGTRVNDAVPNGYEVNGQGATLVGTEGTSPITPDAGLASKLGTSSLLAFGIIRDATGFRSFSNGTFSAYRSDSQFRSTTYHAASRFSIGGRYAPSPSGFADFECLAVAVFRRALAAAEIASIASFYGAS